ncbi:hypothetical protein T07_10107 [Trichinella nelsoni]|uniref:PiggyBac transposable element-derived protein domain-containing protein n=1 Tax=Trichinella nelsoni TaxID=6336 RepID=A0A0V0RE30_9BILA|nr:hypothetical protein T07_10107 [Trichinella nelsoni]
MIPVVNVASCRMGEWNGSRMQREWKTERIVAYVSRTRMYCATQKEILGLAWAMREYLPVDLQLKLLKKDIHRISRVRRSKLKKAPLQTEKCLKNAGQGAIHVCTTAENNLCTVRWHDSASEFLWTIHVAVVNRRLQYKTDLKTSEAASGSQKDLMQFTLDVAEGLTKVNKAYPKISHRCMSQTVNVKTSRRRARRPELSTATRLDQVAQLPEVIQ